MDILRYMRDLRLYESAEWAIKQRLERQRVAPRAVILRANSKLALQLPPKLEDPMSIRPTIMKFGGTSVEDASASRNVVAIVKLAVNSWPVIVVSVIGGFTNSL